jgi:hypothetical protein
MTNNNIHTTSFEPEKYKPAQDLWERISTGLDNHSTKTSINSFSTYKPAPQTWNRIEAGLDAHAKGLWWKKIGYGSVAVLFFALLILLIKDTNFTINPKNKIGSELKSKYTGNTQTTDKENIRKHTKSITKQLISGNYAPNQHSKSKTSASKQETKKNHKPALNIIANNNNHLQTKQKPKKKTKNRQYTSILNHSMQTTDFSIQTLLTKPTKIFSLDIHSPFIHNKNVFGLDREQIGGKKENHWKHLFYGIHYSKEIFARNYSYSDKRKAWSLCFDIGYKWNSAYITTGINFQNIRDESLYEINYLQNEIIGSELRVDSIIYKYDKVNKTYLREYVTSEVNLFDSLEHSVKKTPVTHYSYLRLPISIGYKLPVSNFFITFKAGAEYSLLIRGYEPVPVLNGKEIRILKMTKKSSVTYLSDWQLLTSIGMQYPVLQNINLNIETEYRSSTTSYFDTKSASYQKPFSLSIRAGLIYLF